MLPTWMAANVSAVQMTYIMISLNFFTTRASHPCKHTHDVTNTFNYNNLLPDEGVILLLDRDLQDEWGTRCSFQRCICNSWWVRCYFWILHTNACTASQSNCGCHNIGAVEINRMQIPNYRWQKTHKMGRTGNYISPVSERSQWPDSGRCCWRRYTHQILSWWNCSLRLLPKHGTVWE